MHMMIEGGKISRTLDVHKHLTQEIKIVFKTDGVHITSVDPAYQRMVTTVLKNTACKEYDINETGELVIGIDLIKIRDFLKIGKHSDIFTFDYDDENHRLVVRLGNLIRTMGLLDIESMPDLKPPELLWANKTVLGVKVLHAGVKAMIPDNKKDKSMMKGYLTVTHENLIFKSYSEVEKENTVKNTILTKDRDLVSHLCKIPVKIAFNVIDLEEQVREFKRSFNEVIVETNINSDPIKISVSNEDLTVEYYQTVIIENNEDVRKINEKKPLSKLESVQAARESEKPLAVDEIKKPSMKVLKKDIGWLASPRSDPHTVGEIIQVTKTGYVLLFRGSKKHTEPIEYERDLIEVYRKVNKKIRR